MLLSYLLSVFLSPRARPCFRFFSRDGFSPDAAIAFARIAPAAVIASFNLSLCHALVFTPPDFRDITLIVDAPFSLQPLSPPPLSPDSHTPAAMILFSPPPFSPATLILRQFAAAISSLITPPLPIAAYFTAFAITIASIAVCRFFERFFAADTRLRFCCHFHIPAAPCLLRRWLRLATDMLRWPLLATLSFRRFHFAIFFSPLICFFVAAAACQIFALMRRLLADALPCA